MIAIEEGQTILFYSSSEIFVIPYFENVRLFPSDGRDHSRDELNKAH